MTLSYQFSYSMVANKSLSDLKSYIIIFKRKGVFEPHMLDVWSVRIRAIKDVLIKRRTNLIINRMYCEWYAAAKQELDELINECNTLLKEWGDM